MPASHAERPHFGSVEGPFRRPQDVHALCAGKRYFRAGISEVLKWPFSSCSGAPELKLVDVPLPPWAAEFGVGSPPSIAVDAATVANGTGPAYARCDWPRALALHLDGWLERSLEDKAGPIQSYSFRLPSEWLPAYDRAWVNRIYLFIRRWIAHETGRDEISLFGPMPTARFTLTHDVDALQKTLPLRLKSSVMSGIAVIRHFADGQFSKAWHRTGSALKYATTNSNFWLFDEICQAEAERGFRSIFMFADRPRGSGLVSWLIDPDYRASEPLVSAVMKRLGAEGWQIGIHPGFKTWKDPKALAETRQRISAAAGQEIGLCRQHWLRFSWADTWKAQEAAGVRLDYTLGFNDRPGLRNGAALCFRPWDRKSDTSMDIEVMPTLLMDSHFYDYSFPADPAKAMSPWIDEVIAVGGEASLLWHTQTMHDDYGWGSGYFALLDMLRDRGVPVGAAQFENADRD